jgi:hypothetical protein
MKHFIFILSLVVGAWMLSPTLEGEALSWSTSTAKAKNDKVKKVKKVKKPKIGGISTPELDPSAAGGAMILLLGGVAYIASRRREEDLA